MSREARWEAMAESGSQAGMRLGTWIHRTFGRCTAALRHPIALYCWLRDPIARRASRDSLETLYAAPGDFRARPGPEEGGS